MIYETRTAYYRRDRALVALEAQFTEPLNSMVSKEQRAYVDAREKAPGWSRARVVRQALDLLMEKEPLTDRDTGAAPA